MENDEDDDDLKLVQASAVLLSNLDAALPKLLWRPSTTGAAHGRVHRQVRKRDLDYVLRLIEPFQGEPQLLDARLKYILPPIVEAYLEYLSLEPRSSPNVNLDLQTAVCILLYTLCKVRGYKVIVGFFNNEPRYLETVLSALERTTASESIEWHVPYVLLLWLSHLLLTPFDLASISSGQVADGPVAGLSTVADLPSISARCLQIGLHYLPTATKTQDAAAAMIVRLMIRPDMQKLCLADALVKHLLRSVSASNEETVSTVYELLGPLRVMAGIASSAELSHLIPQVYHACARLANDESSSAVSSSAVAKKLIVKVFRNTAILSLRSASTEGPLLSFLETTSVLEDVIDHLLRSVGDRDTPVRFAAAKAISLIVLELDPAMGHEVIQAVLESLKEDMPRNGNTTDFRSANALRWHGLTLTLGHALFKRTASPEQLPDIVHALVSGLQFEQRTATGSSVGTNVRDAANFGIWSLSRRYTTSELLAVDARTLQLPSSPSDDASVIQVLAIELILSACLDPAGNIRRGSSAALQELVGRHPNQIHDGIALVQIVDYQAVGLRRRAMVDVAGTTADLHDTYWEALVHALLGWRGLGSADVISREAAAAPLARLGRRDQSPPKRGIRVISLVRDQIDQCPSYNVEGAHGLILTLANLMKNRIHPHPRLTNMSSIRYSFHRDLTKAEKEATRRWDLIPRLTEILGSLSPRTIRSELPAAVCHVIDACCSSEITLYIKSSVSLDDQGFDELEVLVEKLFVRQEESILQAIPAMVQSFLALKQQAARAPGQIAATTLCNRVQIESARTTLGGAGRAIALGAVAACFENGLQGEQATAAIDTLCAVVNARTVDWRIIGFRALELAVNSVRKSDTKQVDARITQQIVRALHSGLNDYTIDERGDVGSLVRLQTIACTASMLETISFTNNVAFDPHGEETWVLYADMVRLSLEKLDKVRVQASRCRRHFESSGFNQPPVQDIASVSTRHYFSSYAILPLEVAQTSQTTIAVLEGVISCAGAGAEPLLQASREALTNILCRMPEEVLQEHMSAYTTILARLVEEGANLHPALGLLGFFLDTGQLQRLSDAEFKWRKLLSTVQKAHYKSTDVLRILAAVHVYRGLSEIAVIRIEVCKKLLSMLKTNPYPRVRVTVAETLFYISKFGDMKGHDWAKSTVHSKEAVQLLEQRLQGTV